MRWRTIRGFGARSLLTSMAKTDVDRPFSDGVRQAVRPPRLSFPRVSGYGFGTLPMRNRSNWASWSSR